MAPNFAAYRPPPTWSPFAALLLALSSVFLFGGADRHFHRVFAHDSNSAKNMALATNNALGRSLVIYAARRPDGRLRLAHYNRFPAGGFWLITLAILPFEGDLAMQIAAARTLMLALFCAAAAFAYAALARLLRDRAAALAATSLAFSSYYMLDYNDIVSNEVSMELCAVMLVFHGLVSFQEQNRLGGGRRGIWALNAKVCVALAIGWHAYAVVGPFIAFAVGGAIARAFRNRRRRTPAVAALASAWRRGYAQAGIVALVFGLCAVAYNLRLEHAAFGGERTLTELPSARSILRRTGQAEAFKAARQDMLAWSNFLQWQFHRIGGMALPYALPAPRNDRGELPRQGVGEPSLAWLGAAVTVACGGALLARRRHRLLLATLAACGFCWSWPLRTQTGIPGHEHESVFYLGVPLVLFALLLVAARRRLGARAAACLAVVGPVAFVASAYEMAALSDPDAARQRALVADFNAMRDALPGRDVLFTASQEALDDLFKVQSAFYYYTAGSVVQFDNSDQARERDADFVLHMGRLEAPSLTPNNRLAFLYEGTDAIKDIVAARRRDYDATAAREPAARSIWNLHVVRRDGTGLARRALAYLKAPCAAGDTDGRFFLRVFAADAPAPVQGRPGYEETAFSFQERGLRLDDKCVMTTPLPAAGVTRVATRQVDGDGAELWNAAFALDAEAFRRAYETRPEPPLARARFDVHYRVDRLVYVKEPCAARDVTARFFLHVVPARAGGLARLWRRRGFDNLDFHFAERGAVLPGKCVAVAALPDYAIDRVETGQVAADGERLWRVEFTPPPPASDP